MPFEARRKPSEVGPSYNRSDNIKDRFQRSAEERSKFAEKSKMQEPIPKSNPNQRKPRKTVYLLKSQSHPNKNYIGLTSNLKARLVEHNSGKSPHTAKYSPWFLISAHYFSSEEQARQFEKYLKSGSDHAFAKRHFW